MSDSRDVAGPVSVPYCKGGHTKRPLLVEPYHIGYGMLTAVQSSPGGLTPRVESKRTTHYAGIPNIEVFCLRLDEPPFRAKRMYRWIVLNGEFA
jgi:hypothetical protein